MNIDKIYEYKYKLEKDLTFEEIVKLYREILYDKYAELTDDDAIHCYQLTRSALDIFTQMVEGRKFDEDYLKNTLRW